ncbi:MAG TPA: type II toxin-antitoxin system Phd/YefM family antitoxin [Gammaproteobacteria bacterium]|nr:type II toxin-antitoxin system Phd/YefM family antitoxin [Gammaproteobacteria bacterium]
MKTTSATEIKNRFGQVLESALVEPITIEKSGRPVAVLLSIKEYQRLIELEDRVWAEKARQAEAEGLLGTEQSTRWIQEKLGAQTGSK